MISSALATVRFRRKYNSSSVEQLSQRPFTTVEVFSKFHELFQQRTILPMLLSMFEAMAGPRSPNGACEFLQIGQIGFRPRSNLFKSCEGYREFVQSERVHPRSPSANLPTMFSIFAATRDLRILPHRRKCLIEIVERAFLFLPGCAGFDPDSPHDAIQFLPPRVEFFVRRFHAVQRAAKRLLPNSPTHRPDSKRLKPLVINIRGGSGFPCGA